MQCLDEAIGVECTEAVQCCQYFSMQRPTAVVRPKLLVGEREASGCGTLETLETGSRLHRKRLAWGHMALTAATAGAMWAV